MADKQAPPWMDQELAAYVDERTGQPDGVLTGLVERTRRETGNAAGMQIGGYQGSLMTLLTGLVGARRALEIGTFTGYSSICIARGLAEGGSLVCLDVSEEYTAIAREAWDEAGVADRIELRLGPALESLGDLEGPFDLAFIDADKGGYAAYLDAVVPLLRRGGALLVDNTLWHGDVVRAPEDGSQTGVIQDFNDRLAADDRLESVILPISDGLTLARKR